jgi:hypothetical protein
LGQTFPFAFSCAILWSHFRLQPMPPSKALRRKSALRSLPAHTFLAGKSGPIRGRRHTVVRDRPSAGSAFPQLRHGLSATSFEGKRL